MTVLPPHQVVLQLLTALIEGFALRVAGGRVLTAPVAMRALPGGRIREPDLLHLSAEHRHRVTDKLVEGPADLVIEVVSDDSVSRDRAIKLAEYEAAGVSEYWIIDPRPRRRRADFYVLEADPATGQPAFRARVSDDVGVYRSTVLPGFWIRVAWLWQERPDFLSALVEIIGLDRLPGR